ncbi:disease resistance protein PIK6-NP-like [Aegilops tauschii subsp. strangulata]|uniref:disease resistance protein PIK6-NP-like n=1 Tax=Aegilops tauschii subsp. strangulata TaxID=200361 RepID=UPI003CC84AE5
MDAQGAIDSLLGRLTTVLVSEAQLLGGLRGDVEFISDEMESMNGLLMHLAESHNRDNQVRAWMKQVAGLSRDCEGNVELYVQYVGGAGPGARKGVLGSLLRMLRFVRTMSARHRIATRIRELKVWRHCPAGTISHHPRCSGSTARRTGGGGGSAETIESQSDYNKRKYRLICIEGEGSVGKTTIAQKVYEHTSVVRSFDHMVWINIVKSYRQYSELRREILQQLHPQSRMVSLWKDDKESQNSELLFGKSILVILDAVGGQAEFSCEINRDFRHYDVCANSALIMTGNYFGDWIGDDAGFHTKKFRCETRPIFFRTRALDLAKATAELETLCRVLEENRNNTAKMLLMVCYNELPSHHKSCLMYLSIFPQGHIIMRADLLRRWVCEGLITKRSAGTSTLHDQAERIFDSLVTRGFICPGEISSAGKIKSFTLNSIVHDFIVTDVGFVDTSSRPELAHRFSINSGVAIQEEPLSESDSDPSGHGILTTIESLTESDQWQFLKVLDLRGCKGLQKKHLNSICKILLLKYLSLRNTDVAELPKDIEKLQCLQTLDIRQTAVRVLATKSVVLPMLKHLLAGKRDSPTPNNDSESDTDRFEESFAAVRLPRSIRRMEKLEVLSHVEVAHSDDLTDVGKLLRLRKLGVILQGKKEELELLFQQIEKLKGCLRSLSIQMDQHTKSEGELPSPPKNLQSLNIRSITGGLYPWIAGHDQLTKVTLSETGLGEEALRILGQLRILRCLRLRRKSYVESQLKFKKEEFKSLKSLVVEGSDITSITFETGAAPKMEMIFWSFVSMEIPSGLNRLPS